MFDNMVEKHLLFLEMYINYSDFFLTVLHLNNKMLCAIAQLNNGSRDWNSKYQIFLACTWTPVSSELCESFKETNGFTLQAQATVFGTTFILILF